MVNQSLLSLTKRFRFAHNSSDESLYPNRVHHGLGDGTLAIQGPAQNLSLMAIDHTFPEYIDITVQAKPHWVNHITQLRVGQDDDQSVLLKDIYHHWPAIHWIQWLPATDIWTLHWQETAPLDLNEYSLSEVSPMHFKKAFGAGEATIPSDQGFDYGGEIIDGQRLDQACQTQRYFFDHVNGSDILSRSVTVGQRIQSGEVSVTLTQTSSGLSCTKVNNSWTLRAHQPWKMAYRSHDYTYRSDNSFGMRLKRHSPTQADTTHNLASTIS